jgi:integrase/recombinase XerD
MQSLSKDELRGVLSAAKDASQQDYLMILFAYWHGGRATEVVKLTAGCIRDGFVTLRRLKGSNTTVQPLMTSDDPLLNERALLDFIREMHSEQRVFSVSRTTFWRRMKQYGKAAGVPSHRITPHSLKHSIAMHSIRLAGIENTRVWLGHKSIASTGEYLKVTDAEAAAAIATAAKS